LACLWGTVVLAQESRAELPPPEPSAQETSTEDRAWDFSGEWTGFLGQTFGDQDLSFWGGRYLPKWTVDTELDGPVRFEAELIPYLAYSAQTSPTGSTDQAKSSLHRAWVRFYDENLGTRLGLQEIRFGPGKVLRSLQWFDTLDFQDPTGFSEAVEGLLVRRYFENNSNLWVWGLVNTKDQRYGQAIFSTAKDRPQWGGRMEMQAGRGEMAVSFNHSQVSLYNQQAVVPENRLGLEFHQDLGVGVWGEGAVSQRSNTGYQPATDFLGTLGLDYTFAVLGGLYVLVEQQGQKIGTSGEGFTQSRGAYSGSLPLSVQEQVRATYLESDGGQSSWQLDYRFTSDAWVFGLVGTGSYLQGETRNGLVLLAQWNH